MEELENRRPRIAPGAGDARVGDAFVGTPPIAPQTMARREVHGVEVIDEYAWLADRGSADALAYLAAENRYAEEALRHTEPLRRALYQEFVERIQETDASVPVRLDEKHYYRRTEKGRQYPIYCRRHGGMNAAEEILLDLNELAEGEEFFRVGAIEVSPDHSLLAFSLDRTGGEAYELLVKNLRTGEWLADRLQEVSASVCWANDSQTLFYATLDAARRPYRAFRHVLGQSGRDIEIYREDDEAFFVSLSKTRSRAFVLITSASNVTSEVRYLPADQPEVAPRVVEPRRAGIEYAVSHHGDSFFLRTNDRAKNFRLVERPVCGAAADEREIVPHRPDVKLERVELFADQMVLLERHDGLQKLRVRSYDGARDDYPALPESVYSLRPEWNPDDSASTYRFGYTSLITPLTMLSYDARTRQLETLKVQEVLGGYDRELYVTARIVAPAPDGTGIPVSLVHRRDLQLDGSHPCLLQGYGAYGMVVDAAFSEVNVSLLDRGFVLATAHVRGGGLLGETWHEGGRMLAKRNSFTDFVAAAVRLIDKGYTSPQRLAARGGSAGGLLIGAALNLRPDLFRAAIAQVPFVDVINTMLDTSIPLTVIEFEEWGDPRDRQYFEYMLSYSPYENVSRRDYPALLVSAGLNDPRVQYWEPAKWVARLRARKTDSNPLVLRTHMEAGHGGPSGRYEVLKERALEYAFLVDVLDAPRAQRGG